MELDLTSDFIGITEFRSEMSQTLERIEKTKRPVILIKGGTPSAVVLDIQSYQELQNALKAAEQREQRFLLERIQRAEQDITNERTLSHAQALQDFEHKRQQRKHGQTKKISTHR